MNPVNIHLVLNHVAIMAAIFSVFVFTYGLISKNQSIINVALTGFVVAALVAIPVFTSGESTEEAVENLPGIVEPAIEPHEESAEATIWLISIAGVAALAGLVFRANQFFSGNLYKGLMLVIAVAAAISIGYTGLTGGEIRHPEKSSTSTVNQQDEAEEEDDD